MLRVSAAREAVSGAMGSEGGVMGLSQIGQSRHPRDAESGPCGGAQFGGRERASVIGKADEARVERRIPKCGEEQAIADIEALRVSAFSPRNDTGRPQQGRIGDAGDRAGASPIIHQGGPEDVLADALDDEPLDLNVPGPSVIPAAP